MKKLHERIIEETDQTVLHGDVEERILDYLNKKYKDTFTFVEVTGGSFGSSEKNILVASVNHPDWKILAQRSVDSQGKEVFSDNYIAHVFQPEVLRIFQETMEKVYGPDGGKLKVVYTPAVMTLPEYMGPDTRLSDYLASPSSRLWAVVFIDGEAEEGNRDVHLEELRGLLEGQKVSVGMTLIFKRGLPLSAIREDDITSYEEYLWNDSLSNARCDFLLDGEFEFVYADWR